MRLLSLIITASFYLAKALDKNTCGEIVANNNCVSFSVGPGTGCNWMCQYCQDKLESTNYYFTDGVCRYQGGDVCTGNPIAGVTYTCCSN
ncbi:hypothetical protein N8996_04485 [Candidatus Poseidonia alphae]|nr:hypothetical protein [Candidatus Poseidonia alphae]